MGLAMLFRINRVLKRKKSRIEVTSTNLAHTAPRLLSGPLQTQWLKGTIKRRPKTVPQYLPCMASTTDSRVEHFKRQHAFRISVLSYLHSLGRAFHATGYPTHYQVFVRDTSLLPKTRLLQTRRESSFLVCLWKKISRFSPLTVLSGFLLPCSVRRGPLRFNSGFPRGICAAPGAPTQGPNSFTICRGFTRALSTVRPQWRCGPVTRHVAPTFPNTSPASRISPTFGLISDRCP